ncbi:MoaD/ThiS family protein [Natranaerobius trueperi]|uniref:Thiamine biosynthesis protein ThiS n=1 Tax=Natranaerobius trueperi TaxID=759412 RepID=A0A226C301_9FIRM|nr:MoaD/ThiS family protein [Natranaerobius trueperi]OWZ84787.1 thiamine biosynthesis protein ThiS [Natranaerobius trueperi]
MKTSNKTFELSGSKKVSEILKELDLNSESVLVVKDGELLTRDRLVKDEEIIEIISVVSGG